MFYAKAHCITISVHGNTLQNYWWVIYVFHLQNVIILRADSQAI